MKLIGSALMILIISQLQISASPIFSNENYGNNSSIETYIAGGSVVRMGTFLFVVSLRSAVNNAHYCGGSIANIRWVVTAAQCTIGLRPNDIHVFAGSHSRTGGTRYEVEQIVIHPEYSPALMNNDVSVIKLRTNIIFTSTVRAISMSSVFIPGNREAMAAGWGWQTNPGAPSSSLRSFTTKTIDSMACRLAHSAGRIEWVHPQSTICTEGVRGLGTCPLDTGGPLVSGSSQIGIISWGTMCGNGLPDVYVRISTHRDWITNTIRV